MVWYPANASPMIFTTYNAMPKNPKQFCSKFHSGDLSRSADEHINIFEDLLHNRDIQHEDVACRLFPYTFDEEASHWYIHLPVDSIHNWQEMKDTFLEKFKSPISPSELYRQFMEIRRQEHEPISTFNNRFHKTYTRLRDPYNLNNAATLPVYYVALDCLTSMFVKSKGTPPTNLKEAYASSISVSNDLEVGTATGPLNYLGNPVAQGQIQNINRALSQNTWVMNLIPKASNQLVLHPGTPVSQVPPLQPIYL
ncbi:uncharacterized protein LOC131874453 [Cryptomeria japonica]|uniref:uncharacterized protein LOC131874453 n=1 Tax=Cryptomeria japonica TaxID=3369 RepID=UPI0027DA18E8|nr:uncharacterized protein LOC131874453 [Cryptomeria japonica]